MCTLGCEKYGAKLIETKKVPVLQEGEFDLNDYKESIDLYPYNKNIGEITDENTAIDKAINEWKNFEEYTNFCEDSDNYSIEYEALYDSINDCWLIRTEVNFEGENSIDTVIDWSPHLIVESDGDILALWIC